MSRSFALSSFAMLLLVGVMAVVSTFAVRAGTALGSARAGSTAEILYGSAVQLGDGTARTYLVVDEGRPLEVGVALSESALRGLPADGAHGGMVMPDGHSTFAHVLEMPARNSTPFQHVTLDWNPVGHEPPGIYDRPHFDFHFYTISDAERRAIDPDDPEFMAKGSKLPAARFIPAGYIDPGAPPVPFMGFHLLDPASPELNPEAPEPFTRTFIYGTWDGKMIFAEPMITLEFLEGRPQVTIPVPVAEAYDPDGYYPASYSIVWHEPAREYRVSLTDLEWRR